MILTLRYDFDTEEQGSYVLFLEYTTLLFCSVNPVFVREFGMVLRVEESAVCSLTFGLYVRMDQNLSRYLAKTKLTFCINR